MALDPGKVKVVHNQPYDESVEVSDAEEIASNNPTPRAVQQTEAYYSDQYQTTQSNITKGDIPLGEGGQGGRQQGNMIFEEEEEEEEESNEGESEEEEEQDGLSQLQTMKGGYDPSDYDHLQVSKEIKELFGYITRYTPHNIELECRLMPFVPEYVPAIGDIDAFIKVTRPDGKPEKLGLTILDEPSSKQSDPHVLDLQLRTHAKQSLEKPAPVYNIQDPKTNSKALDSWIENIKELHRQKPATNVHYTRNMPDIETLMQEWPPEFEEALKEVGLPSADLDCDIKQYVDLLCNLLDIPVRGNRIHSLHVLFSLFMEFKNSQHFNALPTTNTDDNND